LLLGGAYLIMDLERFPALHPLGISSDLLLPDSALETTMTLTIHLEPELEKRVREAATQQGMGADEYVRRLIEQNLPAIEAGRRSLWDTVTPEEWQRVTREWVASHDASIPPLPDEAVSRESFYEGRS
jgi:hypothetical protein